MQVLSLPDPIPLMFIYSILKASCRHICNCVFTDSNTGFSYKFCLHIYIQWDLISIKLIHIIRITTLRQSQTQKRLELETNSEPHFITNKLPESAHTDMINSLINVIFI